jgi:hypothetical protein
LLERVLTVLRREPAFEPESAREIGNRLSRFALLPVGNAARVEGARHDRWRQVAARQNGGQGLCRLLRLAALKKFGSGVDRALSFGRVLTLLLGGSAGVLLLPVIVFLGFGSFCA